MTQKTVPGALAKTRIFAILFACAVCAVLVGCQTVGGGTAKNKGAKPTAREDGLTGKTWQLAGYRAETQFIPLEPGHATSARIVFNKDGTLSGTTGINTFGGSWKLGRKMSPGTQAIAITVSGLGKKQSPNEIAARFERDLIRELVAARALKKGKDSIQLLDGRDEILLQFVFSAAGYLY
jgi:heat shock protein HslJ